MKITENDKRLRVAGIKTSNKMNSSYCFKFKTKTREAAITVGVNTNIKDFYNHPLSSKAKTLVCFFDRST